MKVFKEMMLKRRGLFLTVVVLCLIFLAGENVKKAYCLDLKSQADDFLKQERFADLLDFLDILGNEEGQNVNSLQIEYYSALTKSKYLDYLEKTEDWENYYNHADLFNAEIIKSANDFVGNNPASAETIEMQYLAWKANIRGEELESAEDSFSKLIEVVIKYTEENNDTSVFRDIAQRLSAEDRVRQLNKLFDSYKEFLAQNAGSESINRLGSIALEYLQDGKVETAIVIYKHYIDLVLRQYPQAKAQIVLVELADKFRSHGFYPAQDADFAESIYEVLVQKFGNEVLGEEALFCRAYNLESMDSFDRALEDYKYFVKNFPESELLAEIYTRMALINLYSFGRIGMALQDFQKVSNEFSDSFYGPFCAYNAAVLLQWQEEYELASRLYSIRAAMGGAFSDQSKKRLDEIKNNEKIEKELRFILENLSVTEESSTVMMSLKSSPQSAFTGEQVIWSAAAQDFSSGTVQPSFTYDWVGDTGSNEDPGNTAKFSTTYDKVMPHAACFFASVAQAQGIICKAVWVYEISVKTANNSMSFKVGQPVEFAVSINPSSIEDKKVIWQCKISGELIDFEGNKFMHSFDVPGKYEIELIGDMQGKSIIKRISVDIVE